LPTSEERDRIFEGNFQRKMKKAILVSILSFLSLYLYTEEVNRIVARVNDQIVTYKDLNDYCELFFNRLEENNCQQEEIKKNALERLIEDRLILDKAREEEIKVTPALIENKLREIINAYSSFEEFEKSLIERGLNITILKERIKEQFMVQAVIDKYVRSRIKVFPLEITNYYQNHSQEFYSSAKFIFWIASKEEILDEIYKLTKEEGFEKTRKEFKENLLRIEQETKDLRKEIIEILGKLKENEFTIVEIEGKKYFVYLEKKNISSLLPLEKVKERIYNYLWEEKFKKRFKSWLKMLKKEAIIEIYFP
jgi:hypothetical protein